MSPWCQSHYDKLLLGLSLTALSVSAVWWWHQQAAIPRLRALPVAAPSTRSRYQPADQPARPPPPASWSRAAAQSRGEDWRYEVFSPPVIYYDAADRKFSVNPSPQLAAAEPAADLELLEVKPEPYRLQLVGYFGGPEDYLAAFVSPGSAGTLLGRAGRRFAPLGITLKGIQVKKVVIEPRGAQPVYDVAAFAIVHDERTDADVVLDNRSRKYTDTPVAVLQLRPRDQRPRELHEGDTLSDQTATYRIASIRLAPPEVVVTRMTAGFIRSETLILHPVVPAGGSPTVTAAHDGLLRRPPAVGLIANGQ
jgi:hypothetical protein